MSATYLLDTNVISELRKPQARASRSVVAWVRAQTPTLMYVSAITVLELELGVARVERRDVEQGRRLRAWLDERVLVGFSDRVLAVDVAVAQRAARLHVPDPRPERDALIAATALVHGMSVVTRNVADFEVTGVPTINPWVA